MVLLVFEARVIAGEGDVVAALDLLRDADELVETEDDRAALFDAMATLLAQEQPVDILVSLDAIASGAGPDRLWAQRALVVAYAASGRAADAYALATSLTSEPEHAAFGHRMRVSWAAEARDEAEAVSRLSAFAASVSTADSSGVEALASSVSLVAVAFPGADLTGITGALSGRGVTGQTGAPAASATSNATSAQGAFATATRGGVEALVDGLDVSPNPTAGLALVRVSVAEPAQTATVAVYDALGRRVSVLHDGALAAGSHRLAFDASSLPAGVYVVHIRVATAEGGTWTDVRRVTVAR